MQAFQVKSVLTGGIDMYESGSCHHVIYARRMRRDVRLLHTNEETQRTRGHMRTAFRAHLQFYNL
jgi:hypothetical protein